MAGVMGQVINTGDSVTVSAEQEAFLAEVADIIIPNDKYNTVAIDVVRAVINQRIL
jgi:uridine kinase